METYMKRHSIRQCKRWISLSMILLFVARLDGTLADCDEFKDVIQLEANSTFQALKSPGYNDSNSSPCAAEWLITSDNDTVEIVPFDIDLSTNATCSNNTLTFYQDACECNGHNAVIKANDSLTKLTSPGNYKRDSYSLNCRCQWQIHSEKDALQMTILGMNFIRPEGPGSCQDDFLQIDDGSSSSSSTSKKLCGVLNLYHNTTFYTTSKNAWISFNTGFMFDVSTRSPGFEIYYQAIDKPEYPKCSDGPIQLQAQKYKLNYLKIPTDFQSSLPPSKCSWLITSDEKTVSLSVLFPYPYTCHNDSIVIYDGKTSKASVLYQQTCISTYFRQSYMESSSKFVYIETDMRSPSALTDFNIAYVAKSIAHHAESLSLWLLLALAIPVFLTSPRLH